MKLLSENLAKYLPLYIAIVATIAYLKPSYFTYLHGSTDFLLGFVLFLAGLSMSFKDLSILRKSFYAISVGLILKWTLTVFLSVLLAVLFFSHLPDIANGLILTGSVPSGTAATLYTFLAGGNTSIIVAMGILDVFISPVLTPVIMEFFANESVLLSFFALAKKMFFIVIIPITIGMTINHFKIQRIEKIKGFTRIFSSTTILLIIITVVSSVSIEISLSWKLLLGIFAVVFIQVLLPMVAGYKIALLLKLQRPIAIAILFEVGLCNSALAAILALEFFGEMAAIPAVLNMIVNLSLGAFFSRLLGKKNTRDSVAA